MYNLYAIDSEYEVSRIRLTKEAQRALASLFEQQRASFLHEDRERHPYAPNFHPTDGGIIELDFVLPASLQSLSPTAPSNLPTWRLGEKGSLRLKAICAVDSAKGIYCFQALDDRRVLQKHRAIFFNPDATFLNEVPGILVGSRLDAVFEDGVLYFVAEGMVRRFLDMTSIFEEATNDQVKKLFSSPKFTGYSKDFLDPSLSDTWVRRKVTMILKDGILETLDKKEIQAAAKACKSDVLFEGSKIVLPQDKRQLKDLLKFLSEDLLLSPLRTGTVYEVHSKRPR